MIPFTTRETSCRIAERGTIRARNVQRVPLESEDDEKRRDMNRKGESCSGETREVSSPERFAAISFSFQDETMAAFAFLPPRTRKIANFPQSPIANKHEFFKRQNYNASLRWSDARNYANGAGFNYAASIMQRRNSVASTIASWPRQYRTILFSAQVNGINGRWFAVFAECKAEPSPERTGLQSEFIYARPDNPIRFTKLV